ncbi:choline transporter [Xanthomonas oryzae pv. oryzicola]|nr:choline transporter [Xanthomonas oryzae pv. oryzicola]
MGQAMHFPAHDEVYRFMHDPVRPAIEAVATQLQEEG